MNSFESVPAVEGAETKPEQSELPREEIGGIKVGDVINFDGRKVRVRGFTAPEGNPSRAFMVEELSKSELEAQKQRDAIIFGKIVNQIAANPNAVVDREQAMKFWGDLYDQSGDGERMEMQLNELYAQKYDLAAKLAYERISVLESQLNFVNNEGEKMAILSKIEEERDFAIGMEKEASARRSNNR